MPSTTQAYERVFMAFLSFMNFNGWSNPWPVPEALLLYCLAHMRERGHTPKMMGIYL